MHTCTQLYKDVCTGMGKTGRYATNFAMANSRGGIQGWAIGLVFLHKSEYMCFLFSVFSLFTND